jgi:hypothetical protein
MIRGLARPRQSGGKVQGATALTARAREVRSLFKDDAFAYFNCTNPNFFRTMPYEALAVG